MTARDLPYNTQNNGHEPKTVYDANFSPSRLHTLRTRNSAAYKGIYAILMDDNTKDWLSATGINFSTYFSESIDIHHIFPVSWCEKNGCHFPHYLTAVFSDYLTGKASDAFPDFVGLNHKFIL